MPNSIPPTEQHEEQESLVNRLLDKLANAKFFAISALFHGLLVMYLGFVIITKYVAPPSDFESMPGGKNDSEGPLPPNDAPQVDTAPPPPTPDQMMSSPAPQTSQLNALVSSNIAAPSFTLQAMPAPVPGPPMPKVTNAPSVNNTPSVSQKISSMTGDQASAIKAFSTGYRTKGTPGGPPGDGAFTFKAYVAKYAGGDWSSAHVINNTNSKIERGALPNLLYVIGKWSKDKIKGDPYATPLDLASEEIFNVKPAFILMTGTRDFVLSDSEINNLRRYVLLGGAIWGDSTLPGRGSRFDIAFRREMKRVIADKDKEFEALPPDHPLYTNMVYRDVKGPPSGLNYYQEPVYVLKVFDEVSVIYTANSYSGMWQIGLDEKGKIDGRKDEHKVFVALNPTYLGSRDIYYRNLDEPALSQTYKFGTNMVLYLLTRWELKVRNAK